MGRCVRSLSSLEETPPERGILGGELTISLPRRGMVMGILGMGKEEEVGKSVDRFVGELFVGELSVS